MVLRSLVWSALAFAALAAGSVWGIRTLLPPGWLGWAAGLVGAAGAGLLALWLFLPVAVVIATFYIDRVAIAVERRFYPHLPSAAGAAVAVQFWDGIALGLRVLLLNLLALGLAILLPGIGVFLAWGIAAWALGRGLFVAVAMRRMGRAQAQALYARRRGAVLAQGAVLALAGGVPGLNLLVPVLGTAAMVHVLHGGR